MNIEKCEKYRNDEERSLMEKSLIYYGRETPDGVIPLKGRNTPVGVFPTYIFLEILPNSEPVSDCLFSRLCSRK